MSWVDVKNTQTNTAAANGGGVFTGNGPTFNKGVPMWALGAAALLALWLWKGRR